MQNLFFKWPEQGYSSCSTMFWSRTTGQLPALSNPQSICTFCALEWDWSIQYNLWNEGSLLCLRCLPCLLDLLCHLDPSSSLNTYKGISTAIRLWVNASICTEHNHVGTISTSLVPRWGGGGAPGNEAIFQQATLLKPCVYETRTLEHSNKHKISQGFYLSCNMV